jgi:hypothetical protein
VVHHSAGCRLATHKVGPAAGTDPHSVRPEGVRVRTPRPRARREIEALAAPGTLGYVHCFS